MRTACMCNCHIAPDDWKAFLYEGVDVTNVIEAAIACPSCQNTHTPALLNTALPSESVVPQRGVTVITPEGKQMAWEEYEKEMKKRPGDTQS